MLLWPFGVVVVVVVLTMAISVVVAVTKSVAIVVSQPAFHWGMTEPSMVVGVRGTTVAHVFVCGLYTILMSLLASGSTILVAIVAIGKSHRRARQRLGVCGTQRPVAPDRQWKNENTEKRGCLSSH